MPGLWAGCSENPSSHCVQAGISDPSGFIMFPLVIHCLDLVVSAAGIMSIGGKSTATPLQPVEDPYSVIKARPAPAPSFAGLASWLVAVALGQ